MITWYIGYFTAQQVIIITNKYTNLKWKIAGHCSYLDYIHAIHIIVSTNGLQIETQKFNGWTTIQ